MVSFAAAVPLNRLEAELPANTPVVRIMPNAPSLVGQGMNPVAYGKHVTPEARALAEAIVENIRRDSNCPRQPNEFVRWRSSGAARAHSYLLNRA